MLMSELMSREGRRDGRRPKSWADNVSVEWPVGVLSAADRVGKGREIGRQLRSVHAASASSPASMQSIWVVALQFHRTASRVRREL